MPVTTWLGLKSLSNGNGDTLSVQAKPETEMEGWDVKIAGFRMFSEANPQLLQ